MCASEPKEAGVGTREASQLTASLQASQVVKVGLSQVGKESKMVNAKNEPTSQSGENSDLVISPQKVDKLEVDEYLLEKALKAQENALEAMRRKHLAHMLAERNRKHNEAVKRRKQERQNRKGGRK